MLKDSQGRALWIMDERGGHAPVRSFADIKNRQRGHGLPDWWVVAKEPDWTPPEPKSLVRLGEMSFAPGAETGASGGHTKIGAGHKPQGYDERGRYTGPAGGAASLSNGRVRLYDSAADEEPGADEPDKPGDSTEEAGEAKDDAEAARQLEGILVADSGRVVTDGEGGLSGGYEVRGPVTAPPATVTWKNDDPSKPDPKPEELKPQMREAVENLHTKTPQLDSINVNSGTRPGDPRTDPHADGRAVDINKVNGIPVKDLKNAEGTDGQRAREAAKNMEEQAKKDPNINQILGPDGGWNKRGQDWETIEDDELLKGYQNHYHINVYRK